MSDLKSDAQKVRLLQVICGMDTAAFAVAAWEEAISYLFNANVRFHSLEDLRAFVGTQQAAGSAIPAAKQQAI